jgi:hypothetical protein
VRGVDFFVRRTSPYRRQLMITERGLWRLKVRAYRIFGEPLAPSRQFIWNGREKLPTIKGSPQERRMRLKQAVAVFSREYIQHPCAMPNCRCVVHKLGLRQADVVVEVMCASLPGRHLRAANGGHRRRFDGYRRFRPPLAEPWRAFLDSKAGVRA